LRLAFGLVLGLGLGLTTLGCARQISRPLSSALIDEAFAALFPETAAFLARKPGLIFPEKTAQDTSANTAQKEENFVELTNLPGFYKELLLEWQSNVSTPKVLIASPLAAATLAQGFSGSTKSQSQGETIKETSIAPTDSSKNVSGFPHLVVPFGRSVALSGQDYWSVEYDYAKAYADLGKKAAEIVLDKAKKQGSAGGQTGSYCLVVFQENLLRGKEVLEAFTKSFSSIAGESALKIEFLSDTESGANIHGDLERILTTHLSAVQPERPLLIVLGIDDAFAAEEAASGNINFPGPGTTAQPEPLFMADCGSWGKGRANGRLFAWRIEADGRKLGERAFILAETLAKGQEAERISLVPLKLLARSGIF
jgi:hypothetical protein